MKKLSLLIIHQAIVVLGGVYFIELFGINRYFAVFLLMILYLAVLRLITRHWLGVWITKIEQIWMPYYGFMSYLLGMGLGLHGFWPYVVPGILVIWGLIWVFQIPRNDTDEGELR